MSRNTGTFNFAANLEGLLKAPIDAKQLVGTYADLTTAGTWNASGQVWLYNGAIVAVGSDPTPSNNGVYWLCDANNYTMSCAWVKAGSGSGMGTITGATNGLSTGATNVIKLGGTLCEITDISGAYDLSFGGVTPLSTLAVLATCDIELQIPSNKATMALDNTGRASLIGGTRAYISTSANTSSVMVSGSTTSICGELKILDTPNPGTTYDTVLVWDSTDKQVKCLSVSTLTGSTAIGADNGLNKYANTISMGGPLVCNTLINGAYTLSFCCGAQLNTQCGYQISGTTILRAAPDDIDSIYIGDNANFNICGTDNIGIGSWSLKSTTTGSNNIAIGTSALSAITTSNGNVAIGYQAGMNETGSNKLIIANNANTCLISGDFSSSGLTFNADIRIGKTPTTGVSTDGFLVWNSADKCVKQVDVGSIIGASITGATNGLCKVGQTVVLGGTLTGNTCICTLSHALNIGCSINVGFTVDSNTISANHCTNASNGSAMVISNTGLTLSNKTSSISCSITLGTNALVYGGCYHSSYVSRTLVDKEYVDKELSGTSNVLNYKTVSNTYYTGRYDDVIGVSGISTSQIYLYPTPVLGQRISVVDICGNALADPITINGYGKNINNGTCSTINTDYGSVTFVYNGIFWSAIAFVN